MRFKYFTSTELLVDRQSLHYQFPGALTGITNSVSGHRGHLPSILSSFPTHIGSLSPLDNIVSRGNRALRVWKKQLDYVTSSYH